MRAHVRVEWVGTRATRGPVVEFANLAAMEAHFEKQCNRVENNRLGQVHKVEVKQGHKVLFMQRFENGKRL